MDLRIRLTGSEITRTCWISFIGKRQQAFKIRPVKLKSGTPRTSLKRLPAGVERSNSPRLIFTTTKNLNKNCYFYSYKAWKNKSGSYLNLFNFFLHFRLLVSNTKNPIGAISSFLILSALFLPKFKYQFVITFMTYSSKSLANIRSI